MSELVSEVFDLDDLPAKCVGGLALEKCTYTQEMLEEAANFTPDPVLIRAGRGTRWNLLFPPKVEIDKKLPKIHKRCEDCDQICLVRFEMDGPHVKKDTKVELEYVPGEPKNQPNSMSTFLIGEMMRDAVETDPVFPGEPD